MRRLADAVSLLKRVMSTKCDVFGTGSVQAADTHQLFGAVRLTQVTYRFL
jgi:hypothetical protein